MVLEKAGDMMKVPPRDEWNKCFDARCRSKRGEYLPSELSALCARIRKEYPEWYSAMEPRAFNATVPFGSGVHQDEPFIEETD